MPELPNALAFADGRMKVRQIFKGHYWSIAGVAADAIDPTTPGEYRCEVLDWLNAIPQEHHSDRDKLLARIETAANNRNGPAMLGDKNCHQVAKGSYAGADYSIWQIRAGNLRLLFFYDAGWVVVCSHGFVKSTPKTPKSEQVRAIEAWKRYRNEVVLPREKTLRRR